MKLSSRTTLKKNMVHKNNGGKYFFCSSLVKLPAKNFLSFCPFHQRSNIKCTERFEEVSCGETAAEQRAQTQRASLFCCCMNLHFLSAGVPASSERSNRAAGCEKARRRAVSAPRSGGSLHTEGYCHPNSK